MDNRFGIKDFFLFSLLLAVLVSVWLAMKQFDRQNDKVLIIGRKVDEITADLARISANGGGGMTTGGGTGAPTRSAASPTIPDKASDPFNLVREAQAMPGYAQGDWLVMNLGTKLGKITPYVGGDTYGTMIQARVMEPLIIRDPVTLAWQPLLAESWDVSPDGLGVTFRLRHNIVFSDGTPMTADDVKFTFDLVLDPDLAAARARSYIKDNGMTCDVVDPYTVRFHIAKPYYNLLGITGGSDSNSGVCSKKFYSQFKAREINDNPGLLIGTGPYRLDDPNKWRPGTRMVLYRNERYWGPTPSFNRIVYLEDQEEVVYATKLRNAEVDYSPVTPEQFEKFGKDAGITKRCDPLEYQSILGGYTYIAWNEEKPFTGPDGKPTKVPTPFADKRVRQALTMMVDRERMARELWYGHATVATGPFSSNGKQADPSVKPWPYDVARARALLKEAGYEDRDGDGLIDGPDGKPFRIEFLYSSGSAFSERIMLFLKDQLFKGGVPLDVVPLEFPQMIERIKKSQFEMTSLGWTSAVESDPYQIFHSSQRGDAGDNRTGYANLELDKLIDAGRSEIDEAKRMETWHAVHRILAEDQPYTFLLERKSLAYHDRRVQNIKPTRMGMNFMQTEPRLTPWFVPAGQQLHTGD